MQNKQQRLGVVLILIGIFFLVARLFSWSIGDYLWPLVILLPGVALLVYAARPQTEGWFYIPGCVLTTIGAILLLQNAYDYFQSWAYAWALIPASVGLGLTLQGDKRGSAKEKATGRRMTRIFGAVFVVFAVMFESFIFNDVTQTWLFKFGLPLALIVGGAFLLLNRDESDTRSYPKTEHAPPATPPEAAPQDAGEDSAT